MYAVRYLITAVTDMQEIISYISKQLCNPEAASRLADEFIEAGNSIADFPYGRPVYRPIRELAHEYRPIYVKNYIMFYWVDENSKTVNIERVIYSKSNIKNLLK